MRWSFGRVLLALAVLNVLPLFAAEYLPFTDFSEHTAAMASFANLLDRTARVQEHYEVAWGRSQYLLYHFVGGLLTIVFRDAIVASKLLLAGVGIAWPFAVRAFLTAYRRPPWLALASLPLLWNRALVVGFLPYVASLPLLLWGLAGHKEKRSAIMLAVISLGLFYLHLNAYLVFVGVVVVKAVGSILHSESGTRLGDEARRNLFLLPSAIAASAFLCVGRISLHSDTLLDPGETSRLGVVSTAYQLGLWAHDVWASHADEGDAMAYWMLLLGTGVHAALAPRGGGDGVAPDALLPFCVHLDPLRCASFSSGRGGHGQHSHGPPPRCVRGDRDPRPSDAHDLGRRTFRHRNGGPHRRCVGNQTCGRRRSWATGTPLWPSERGPPSHALFQAGAGANALPLLDARRRLLPCVRWGSRGLFFFRARALVFALSPRCGASEARGVLEHTPVCVPKLRRRPLLRLCSCPWFGGPLSRGAGTGVSETGDREGVHAV